MRSVVLGCVLAIGLSAQSPTIVATAVASSSVSVTTLTTSPAFTLQQYDTVWCAAGWGANVTPTNVVDAATGTNTLAMIGTRINNTWNGVPYGARYKLENWPSAQTTAITVNFPSASGNGTVLMCYQVRNAYSATTALDQSASSTNPAAGSLQTSITAPSSGSFTTTAAGEVLLMAAFGDRTTTFNVATCAVACAGMAADNTTSFSTMQHVAFSSIQTMDSVTDTTGAGSNLIMFVDTFKYGAPPAPAGSLTPAYVVNF